MSQGALVNKSQLLKNTFYNSFAQAFSLISVFVFTPLLLAEFGRLQFGLYTLAASVVATLALLDFGIGQSLIVQIAEHDELGEQRVIRSKIKAAYLVYGIIGILVALALVILGLYSNTLFSVNSAEGLSLSSLLFVNAVVQLFYWPLQTARHVLAGFKDYKTVSTTALLIVLLNILAMIATLALERGPVVLSALAGLALIIGQARTSLILYKRLHPAAELLAGSFDSSVTEHSASTIGTLLTEHSTGTVDPATTQEKTPLSPEVIKGLILAGLPLFVIQVLGTLMHEQTDRLVLGVMLGGVAVATYELGAKFSLMFAQMVALGVSAVLPVVSNIEARQDNERMRRLFLRGGRYLSLALFPVAALLILLSDIILRVWLGRPEPEANLVMQLLLISQFFHPLYILSDSILTGKRRFKFWISVSAIIALINLGVSILLVQFFGVPGAAAGTVLANLIEFPLFSYYILRKIDLDFKDWFKSSILPASLLLILPILAATGAKALLASIPLLSLIVASLLLLGIYYLTAYAFVLSDWEKEQLRGFFVKVIKQ